MLPILIRNRQALLAYAATYVCTDLLCPTRAPNLFYGKKIGEKNRLGAPAPKNPNGGRRWIWMTARDTSRRRYRCSDSRQPCSTFDRFDSCMRIRKYAGLTWVVGAGGLTWCQSAHSPKRFPESGGCFAAILRVAVGCGLGALWVRVGYSSGLSLTGRIRR